jgi:hypothetical protein
LRKDPRRLLHRTTNQIRDEIRRDEVEKNRADHLEHLKAQPKDRGDPRPTRAGDSAAEQRAGNDHDCWKARKTKCHGCSGGRADQELAFSADVEHTGAKRDRDREPGDEKGRCAYQRPRPKCVP